MRIVFVDPALRRLYEDASYGPPRYDRELIRAFRKRVQLLGAVSNEVELRSFRSARFEKLKGDRGDQYSIRVHHQWRLVLQFRTEDDGRVAVVIELVDYH